MRLLRIDLIILLTAIVSSEALVAQDSQGTAASENISVLDVSFEKDGGFIDDIQADEIRIDGKAESRVTAIEPIGELPLRVVFLVDISASQVGVSTDGRRRGIRQEAQRFYQEAIKLLPLRVSDSACLVAFNHRITVLQDFTSNKDLLMKSVSNSPPPIGPTRLLDALHLSNRALAVQGDSRRVVIVLTDGNDTSSSQAIEGVYKEAIDHNVRVYFIVSQRDSQRFSLFGRDIKKHEKFVKRTGGRALSFRDEKSMDKLITRIYDELEHLKRISITSQEPLTPDLEISVSRKGVRVNHPSPIK